MMADRPNGREPLRELKRPPLRIQNTDMHTQNHDVIRGILRARVGRGRRVQGSATLIEG